MLYRVFVTADMHPYSVVGNRDQIRDQMNTTTALCTFCMIVCVEIAGASLSQVTRRTTANFREIPTTAELLHFLK